MAINNDYINIISGSNITEAQEPIIIHQCNCITKKAKGIAKLLFDTFPDANIYAKRTKQSIPGTINIVKTNGKIIVNIFGQFNVGYPKLPDETIETRMEWFRQGLDVIALNLDTDKGVAMPYLIGCGPGDWSKYYEIIYNWASMNNIQVTLYDASTKK